MDGVLGFIEWYTIWGELQSCNHFYDSEILFETVLWTYARGAEPYLLFFMWCNLYVCSHNPWRVWIILFVEALIIQQWYQSYGWEHTKVRDTVVWRKNKFYDLTEYYSRPFGAARSWSSVRRWKAGFYKWNWVV